MYNKIGSITKEDYRHREQTSGYQWGEREGEEATHAQELRDTSYYV